MSGDLPFPQAPMPKLPGLIPPYIPLPEVVKVYIPVPTPAPRPPQPKPDPVVRPSILWIPEAGTAVKLHTIRAIVPSEIFSSEGTVYRVELRLEGHAPVLIPFPGDKAARDAFLVTLVAKVWPDRELLTVTKPVAQEGDSNDQVGS